MLPLIIENGFRKLQHDIFETEMDTQLKTTLILDLFDTRKKISDKSEIEKKASSFVLLINSITPNPKLSIFMFIGHGWNTNLNFDISDYNNFHILLLKEQSCYLESKARGGFNPKDIISTGSSTVNTWVDVNQDAKIHGNNTYIHFDSNKYTTVPDMVLTLHNKSVYEHNIFVELGNSGTTINSKTMLLSELVSSISKTKSENVIIQIMACRSNITQEQKDLMIESFPTPPKEPDSRFVFKRRKPTLTVNNQDTLIGGTDILDKMNKTEGLNITTLNTIKEPPSVDFYL